MKMWYFAHSDVVVERFQYLPPIIDCTEGRQMVFIGGYHNINALNISETKRNFNGCIQQVYVQVSFKYFKCCFTKVLSLKRYQEQLFLIMIPLLYFPGMSLFWKRPLRRTRGYLETCQICMIKLFREIDFHKKTSS